jgi:hypothetical protein
MASVASISNLTESAMPMRFLTPAHYLLLVGRGLITRITAGDFVEISSTNISAKRVIPPASISALLPQACRFCAHLSWDAWTSIFSPQKLSPGFAARSEVCIIRLRNPPIFYAH